MTLRAASSWPGTICCLTRSPGPRLRDPSRRDRSATESLRRAGEVAAHATGVRCRVPRRRAFTRRRQTRRTGRHSGCDDADEAGKWRRAVRCGFAQETTERRGWNGDGCGKSAAAPDVAPRGRHAARSAGRLPVRRLDTRRLDTRRLATRRGRALHWRRNRLRPPRYRRRSWPDARRCSVSSK